ncbi:hypothetical protein ABG79_00949 [Caloramator mitchellensis]|uniref:Tellurite resistance protein TehA n=1 Tax=Caloramator mitchellensis TaxID=908809 RepID=A0A0R3K487_CALMK|nr:SLAC1 anion channel family protein [Caloramator mitchellensis]KRQ87151.1 hypothetical protein ABG79_00949 [Caloramator mitchellensis]
MKDSRIKNFPISFFSVIMGLAGYTIATQKTESLFNLFKLSNYIAYTNLTLFIIISALYIIKTAVFSNEVKYDLNHPVKMAFVPTISIAMLLLSISFLEISSNISRVLFFIGAPLHLILSLITITKWIQHPKFQIQHFNPAWFVPILGNLLVPIAGVKFINKEILWFFFSIGIVFWVPFLSILLYRVIFHNNLSEKLMPTLFILLAPPSVAFVSYMKLVENIDNFAKVLYSFALFTLLLIVFQYNLFTKIKFYLSWWAYIFPLSSFSIASYLVFSKTKFVFYKYTFIIIFIVVSVLTIIIAIKTLRAIFNKEICIEEE